MFSRFDNMMQHTHTHNRPKKKDSSDSSEGRLSPMSIPEDHSMMHVPSLPSSPATSTIMMENHHHLLNDEGKFAAYYQNQHQPTSPTSEIDFIKYKQQLCGYSPQHFSSSESTSASSQQNQRQWSPMHYSSPTSPSHSASLVHALSPAHSSLFDATSNTVAQPPKPLSSVTPTDCFHQTQHQHQPRRNSIHSETTMLKRRLSYVDLSTPIQELGHSYSTPSSTSSDTTSDEEADEDVDAVTRHTSMPCYLKSRFKADGIDITPDEFEALQGFGKFCSEPVVREPILMTRITTSPTCSVSYPIKLPPLRNVSPTAVISNNTTSQINAFRQQISTSHESFSRNRT
ncbi:hypothetical protein MAM1_0153c06709 [Mucor ambiguus]|uniref:Uncharacterized protein n=1 Tax=Mucor ambiguus TaxID=91626 RepID=A0A0C9M9T4_9FUNG|nr:hypothetical protein MAM1_0153c06709 [Mucor ambiguus]